MVGPVESRGNSCLFLFVEPSGFNGVLLQSEERFKEQPREHRWSEGEKQPQAGWTGNSGQEGACWGWSHMAENKTGTGGRRRRMGRSKRPQRNGQDSSKHKTMCECLLLLLYYMGG